MADRDYERLRVIFAKAPCDERLRILRHEMMTPISGAKTSAEFLAQMDISDVQGLPEGFTDMFDILLRSTREIHTTFFAMTDIL